MLTMVVRRINSVVGKGVRRVLSSLLCPCKDCADAFYVCAHLPSVPSVFIAVKWCCACSVHVIFCNCKCGVHVCVCVCVCL